MYCCHLRRARPIDPVYVFRASIIIGYKPAYMSFLLIFAYMEKRDIKSKGNGLSCKKQVLYGLQDKRMKETRD